MICCEKCGVHFRPNPLPGGARHLDSEMYSYARRKWALAIQELGFHIRAVIKIRQIAIIMRLIGPLRWGTFPSTGAPALVMHATKAKSR